MHSKIFLYGSSDSGALNYFSHLFFKTDLCAKNFNSPHEFRELIDDLKSWQIPIVLTGSSIGPKTLDKLAINECRKRSVRCLSVIEHWSWYRERFEVIDQIQFPEKILVNDLIAKQEAISAGLPRELLVPLGNPVLESMAILASTYKNRKYNRNKLRARYRLPLDREIVIFISEELKSEFGDESTSLLGFDEYQVLEDIVTTFKNERYHFVVKKHPAEHSSKYLLISKDISYIENAPIIDLVEIADIIIGMGSMLLLELAIFRADVISYRPSAKKSFIGVECGAIIGASNKQELRSAILKKASGNEEFGKNFIGSKLRILKYLRDIEL